MTMTNMTDARFIELTRASVATPPPADADANTIREYNGRVTWLARVDANNEGYKMAKSNLPTCTGKIGSTTLPNHYGRKICDTCGNSVFPNTKGELRKHVAKKWNDGK